jgi:uncharacterized membrane protein (GlpM family)
MDALAIKIALSFVVAGAWVAFSTLVAEKHGSRLGGLIAGMPSNAVVGLLFLGWAYGPVGAAEVASVVPLAMVSYLAFLLAYIGAAGRWGMPSFAIGLLAWLIVAAAISAFGNWSVDVGVLAYSACTLAAFFIADRVLRVQSKIRGGSCAQASEGEVAFRVVLAGGMVALVVAAPSLAGPYFGGLLMTFPAATMSNLYILARAQGMDFSRAAAKSMILSSGGCYLFILLGYFTYPWMGVLPGTLVSYAAAALYLAAIKPFVDKMK